MQLPRIVIATVFFVIGALIAIPAITRMASSSNASGTPSPTPSATVTATPTVTSTVKRTPAPTPTPKPTTPKPTPTPTRVAPPPPTTVVPARPLRAGIGTVSCPGRTVAVTVRNTGAQTEDYSIEQNGSAAIADRLGPGASRTREIKLTEDRATTITVTWRNTPVQTVKRTANCTRSTPVPGDDPPPPDDQLPHTGPDSDVMLARILTGVAAMVTGAIILWWGGLWPRRREQIFSTKN